MACPDNVANEPFCYRRVDLDWEGDLGRWFGAPTARVGDFGPSGEQAFLLSGEEAGTPMGLAFWDGEGFDIQPWGVVPALDHRNGRIPVHMFDGIHSDLVVGGSGPGQTLGVAPWTSEGPGEPVIVVPPAEDYIVSLFFSQAVLDVDGDGLDEIAVYVGPQAHRLVGNLGGVPVFFGEEIVPLGSCGQNVVGIGAGYVDVDGFADLAAIGSCEARENRGIFAFSAEWGDGTGGFAPVGVEYPAVSPSAWLGVADLDGDGLDDVVTASEGGSDFYKSYVEVHRSRGDRSFEPPLEFWNESEAPGAYYPTDNTRPVDPDAFIFGDVDGDGVDDLIFQRFMLAVVQATGAVEYLEMFDIAWDAGTTEVVSAFDLNGDGLLDFIVHDAVMGNYALMSSA